MSKLETWTSLSNINRIYIKKGCIIEVDWALYDSHGDVMQHIYIFQFHS